MIDIQLLKKYFSRLYFPQYRGDTMTQAASNGRQVLTREEYLEMEAQSEFKSEFYGGQIFAMTGGSPRHSQICVNVIRRVAEAIDHRDCRCFESNMKLEIVQARAFVYPDVMVVCGDIELARGTTDAVINPVLIVEVLSPSTESFDRGKKFEYYRMVPSLREYVVVSQETPMVESYYKQDKSHWTYTVTKGLDQSIPIRTLDRELSLGDLYLKVDGIKS